MLSLARASLPRKAMDAKRRGSGRTSTASGTLPGAWPPVRSSARRWKNTLTSCERSRWKKGTRRRNL
nr:MAG TPA: hypothetical protein [Caudoviricetes sp.]